MNVDDYLMSRCTCPFWNKHWICKHFLVVAFIKGLAAFPALDKAIESNPKRGRKKNNLNCYTREEYIQFNDQLFPLPSLALPNSTAICANNSELTVSAIIMIELI